MTWLVDNYLTITQSIGGLGLFLLGMIIMTDGLRALAGDAIRSALFRFTRSPLSGAATGAASTAILQSSSATTVAAVGFVAAGLMTFPEALGIIFGANIGTTITGWLVALLGFKLKLGTIVLPLIFVGALLKLFASGKLAATGLALAGFALIFTGISTLQEGMAGLQGIISFTNLPGDTLTGRLLLVLLGIIFTIITQSSSAGVAAALTALFAGLINFEQAAALVIGMDVGTTVTAAVATIGSSLGARRTGYSHVIYNLLTGVGALLLITPYVWLWEYIAPGKLNANAEIALVAFHSSFNILGVIIVLPFTRSFARMIERLVKGSEDKFIQRLDKSLLDEPSLALGTLQIVIHDELLALLSHIRWLISSGKKGQFANLAQLQHALDKTHLYIDQIHLKDKNNDDREHLLAMNHALDHMQRLHERCDEDQSRVLTARETHQLKDECSLMNTCIMESIQDFEKNQLDDAVTRFEKLRQRMYDEEMPYRQAIMEAIANGELTVPDGTDRLEAIRWLRRVSHHLARIMQHLQTVKPGLQK